MPVTTPPVEIAESEKAIDTAIRRRRPWWQPVLETVALTAVAVVGLETYFNLTGVGLEEFLQPDPVMGCRHIPDKRVVWRLEGFSDEKINSAGLRDVEHQLAKPAGVTRIALLGDSATEALQVRLNNTYARALERRLRSAGANVEVINFGCSSYSTGQEYLQLKGEVAQYKPDITILMYNRGDNLENVRNPTSRAAEPRPYFYLDSTGKLQQDSTILDLNKKALTPNAVQAFLSKNSRIYGVFSQTNLALTINEPLYHKIKGFLGKFNGGSKLSKQPLVAPYPVQDGWRVTSSLISAMNAQSHQDGSKFIVMCFPNIVQDKEYGKQIDAIKALSQTEHFSFLDLTPTVRWDPDPFSLFVKYHFSDRGHKMTTDQVIKLLSAEGMVASAATPGQQ